VLKVDTSSSYQINTPEIVYEDSYGVAMKLQKGKLCAVLNGLGFLDAPDLL